MGGLLITFEGGEASGKGTQVGLLKEALEAQGRDVVVTREPGGTEAGERIRYLLKHDKVGATFYPQTEILLFVAARAQNYLERIKPALGRGAVVICDRFIDSSVVYQGMGRGLGEMRVKELNAFATDGRLPDLTFVLDVPLAITAKRLERRPQTQQRVGDIKLEGAEGELVDRMEDAGEKFFETVRAGYLKLAAEEPGRFVVVDASGNDPKIIAKEILTHVQDRLAREPKK